MDLRVTQVNPGEIGDFVDNFNPLLIKSQEKCQSL